MDYMDISDEFINDIMSYNNTKSIFDSVAAGINMPNLFFNPDGMHGKGHTIRVMKLLSIISQLQSVSDNEKMILAYAGLYHDIGGKNDFFDQSHGIYSYKKLKSLGILRGIRLITEDKEIMRFIIENHSISDQKGIENIVNYKIYDYDYDKAISLYKIFKDADGLDRVRLGDLDERHLRLQASKGLIPIARYLFFESDIDLI